MEAAAPVAEQQLAVSFRYFRHHYKCAQAGYARADIVVKIRNNGQIATTNFYKSCISQCPL
jgi:hypothetical protein